MSGKTKITPRPYQLELLEAAIEENTIVVLGTGAGKTFVSVLLIRELQHQILGSFQTHKRTIFLVTTVPLVAQQAKVVRNNLDVSVGEFKGDSKIDNWSKYMWQSKFEQYHVLVMTAQIFVNILSAGFVQLNKINLVIFDECHHATKDHPYSQVMRLFNQELDQLPRVLGLTAALIQGKCRAFEVEKRISELETILKCRAQTSQDLMTVQKFATRPAEHRINFNSNQDDQRFINVFTTPIQFLAAFPKKSKSPTYNYVKDTLVDCSQVLEEVGPLILYDFIEKCLNNLELYRNTTVTVDKALINLCYTHLKMFQRQYNRNSGVVITSKLKCLLQILEDFGIKNGESGESSSSVPSKEKLCGIIFVQQRSTALALAQVLQYFAKEKSELRYIRCSHIVGHGATQSQNGPIAKMADMTTAKQQEVLSQFRSHKINLLVSTSVVEEGLDVPQCNLVIRYSLPDDVCSYLQSRGRARASSSQYIMMVDDKCSKAFDSQLGDMRAIEKMLEGLCHGRHVPVVDDGDEDENLLDKSLDEIIPPFCPHGEGTQTRATGASSIQLLYMYCQKRLPSDDFYHPVPIFRISKLHSSSLSDSMYEELMNPNEQYRCTITMPTSCPLLDPIIGRPMDMAKLAKRDASVEAIRQLYNAKELNDNLVPADSDGGGGLEDEDDSELQEEKKIVDAGTIRRKQKYKIQHAELLSECQPVIGRNYLYMIMFQSTQDKIPQVGEEVQSYGIITSQHLPLDTGDVTLYHGDEKLSVTMHRLDGFINLNTEEKELIMKFHYNLFEKILGLKKIYLEADDFKSTLKRYVVIPITILTGPHMTGVINYELMDKVVKNETSIKWPCSPAEYRNTLVRVNHRDDIDDVTRCHRLYCVTKVCTDRNPHSSFPDGGYTTFQDFYWRKYKYNFMDPDQPLLEVMYASTRLDHLTQRHSQSHVGEESPTRKTLELFPEICDVHPLSVELYKLARLLPSFFYRLETMLSARELITGVKLSCYGMDTFTSPSCALVMQAFTLQGAQDCFNMERLELLGDSFLKMITTVSLHNTLPGTDPVRVLTHRRSEMFSNVRLYYLAKKKHIPSRIKATVFKARSMWLPPGYKVDNTSGTMEHEQMTNQVIPDKRVADCAEALIGAYILAGGIVAGIRFLEWLGYFKTRHQSTETNNTVSSSSDIEILLISDVLGSYFSSLHTKRQPPNPEADKKLLSGLQKFNSLWKFHDRYILLEAMTHISYTYNRVTGSYQRLELLGDAILDYIVTSYIYCRFPDYDEGRVSLLRSAIVSNTTLALLAVVHDFHKMVKHTSPKLFSKIQQFTAASTDIVNRLKDQFEDIVLYESENNLNEDEDVDTLDPPKVLADIVESLVGAVFLDSNKNLKEVWCTFQPLFNPFIDKFSRKLPVSPVRKLLETDIGGTATFRKQKCGDQEECVVKIKGKGIVVSAVASNYKAAKKAASRKAFSEL